MKAIFTLFAAPYVILAAGLIARKNILARNGVAEGLSLVAFAGVALNLAVFAAILLIYLLF